MRIEQKAFPLRLPLSLRAEATELARADGISLNTFVGLAISEKITRMKLAQAADETGSAAMKRQIS